MQSKDPEVLNEVAGLAILASFASAFIPPLIMNYMAFRKSKVDPALTKKVNSVLQSNRWEMRIINMGEMPNAFSIGDTRVYITSALRKILTDDESVSVMIHEVGHSKFFHIPETLIHLFGFNAFARWLEKVLLKYLPKRR